VITHRVVAASASLALGAGLLLAVPPVVVAAEREPASNDCLVVDGELRDSLATFEVVDCTEEHNSEVIKMLDYPADAGAPSTIADRVYEYFGRECTFDDMTQWIGGKKFRLPIRVGWTFRLPTDSEWEAGARWAACSSIRSGPQGQALSYTGKLPEIFASTPLLDWAMCPPGTPKSGQWNNTLPCTAKSKWIYIPGIFIKGKPGKNYPKDFQAKADALCVKQAKPFLVKGAKTKPIAGLGPAKDFPPGEIYGDCFIARADWNGSRG
jgi:hypothetical protein